MDISAYAKNILFFIIFIVFAGIILPDDKYKKYIDMVIGLVLVFIIIEPVSGIFAKGVFVPGNDLFAGIDDSETSDISQFEAAQNKMIKDTLNNQLFAQLKSLLSEKGYELTFVDFTVSDDFNKIEAVHAVVSKSPQEAAEKSFIRIEPITINPKNLPVGNISETEEIRIIISGFYNIDVGNIFVSMH